MPSRLRSNSTPGISFFSFQDIITAVTGILVLVTLILTLYLERSAADSTEVEPLRLRWEEAVKQLEEVTARIEEAGAGQLLLAAPRDPARLEAEIREWQAQVQILSNRLAASRQRSAEQVDDSEEQAEKLGLAEVRERAGSIERELAEWQRNNSTLETEFAVLESLERELRNKVEAATNQHRLWLLPDLASAARQPVLLTVSRTNVISERFNQPSQRRVFPADQTASLFAAALHQWNPSRDYLVFYVRPSGIELFYRCLEAARSAGFQIGYDAVEENKEIVFSTPTPP